MATVIQYKFPTLRPAQMALYTGSVALIRGPAIAGSVRPRSACVSCCSGPSIIPGQPRYAYVAPLRTQAKSIAWDLLKRLTKDIPDAVPSESELSVPLPNAAKITLMGSDHPDTLRGAYGDGAVLDEYAQTRPRVWANPTPDTR